MKPLKIEPIGRLSGEVSVPGDKSISHRAIMLGAIARGRTSIKGLPDSDDCNYTMRAFNGMGIKIDRSGGITYIEGKGLKGLKMPNGPIYAGNSGTTMRILPGILAGQDFEATLTADEGLSKRPMRRIVEPLSLMGIDIRARGNEYPPVIIRGGKVKAIDYQMPLASAQVKSAILFAALYADGATIVREKIKSRDHTERMMGYFGADIDVDGLIVTLKGGRELKHCGIEIPADISSASFFMAGASLLKGSSVRIDRVGINPSRAGILDIFSRMGVNINISNRSDIYEPVADITVEHGKPRGVTIEEDMIPGIIDELPIIFVMASLSSGRTVIKGARELRVKETDRIASMQANLEKMGARIDVRDNDIIIDGVSLLKGAPLKSFGDHRTCMAMTIAALTAEGDSTIDDTGCVNKSFPGFFQVLGELKRSP